MKPIRYFSRVDGVAGVIEQTKARNVLIVSDFDEDLLQLTMSDNSTPVLLDAVQVDKLRQQFHGWLHERAQRPDGDHRWEELT